MKQFSKFFIGAVLTTATIGVASANPVIDIRYTLFDRRT